MVRLQLRTLEERSDERHASWPELAYNLVIVVSLAQLSHAFIHHPDWLGFAVTAGLFARLSGLAGLQLLR